MATIPTPRSYTQILGEMIDAFLSKNGLSSLPPGDPILTMLEAASQSDVRSTQDIFQYLSSLSLDRATGPAVDRIGADEGLTRIPESTASGYVTISDSSFTKKSTTVFQGKPAPIIGTTTLYVADATNWPSGGTNYLYIGRGTGQYEGPIAYTTTVNNTTYWTINLVSGTQRFHNLGENVVLAQGGDRTIDTSVIVQTTTSVGEKVQFSVLYPATIPDGETEVTNVTVVAKKAGISGNVPVGAITEFSSQPFVGATVTNPSPFTNGRAIESYVEFKERIKNVRGSRSKGTALAIKTAVTGASSVTENKRIISASVISKPNPVLVIDDGTGYEEKTTPINYETIVDSAVGGEQYFSLANGRPVTKAFATTKFLAPFNLSNGSTLTVKVGGVDNSHTFSEDQFIAISSASAYEVVASINSNYNIDFSARTSDNGTSVTVFSKTKTNENIEVVDSGANEVLGFSNKENQTLLLYKNDVLLSKDGALAVVQSRPQSLWSPLSSGETIQIRIDGAVGLTTPTYTTFTITDADFVNSGTSYSTVSQSNSLESWAKVFEYKISGISATENSGVLELTSNLGRNSRAKIEILGGTLVSKGMFVVGSASGATSDYTLDRNLGQIFLSEPLQAGDKLTAGSYYTRAFIQSTTIPTTNLSSSGNMWFFVDGNTSIVTTGIGIGTTVTFSVNTAEAWGDRVRATVSTNPFGNVQIGDWLIVNDPACPSDAGAFRIVGKSTGYVEIERPTSYTATGAVVLTRGGFVVVRSSAMPQLITIPSGSNYTALTFTQQLNSLLRGATAKVYQTNKMRVFTNSNDGDIALVLQDAEAEKLKLSNSIASSITSHLPAVKTSNTQAGTPRFENLSVSSSSSTSSITDASLSTVNSGNFIVGFAPNPDSTSYRYSNHNHISPITEVVTNTVTLRNGAINPWLPTDRVYEAYPYALNAYDNLTVLVDNDVLSKRYNINMYRRARPGSSTYGASNDFEDSDNANASLAVAFGTDFNWQDFAVWMKARTKTHLSGGVNTTKTILWRFYRYGPEGNIARVQYRYPKLASQTTNVETTSITSANNTDIKVVLPSGSARTGTTLRTTTRLGVAATSVSSSLYTYYYVSGLSVSSASRTSNVTTLTLTLPGPITDHGLAINNVIYFNSTSGSFTSGAKTITARSATTISFAETAADVGATANPGTVSYDPVGIASVSGSTVVAGDIFGVQSGTGIAAPFGDNATRIFTLDAGGLYWQTTSDQAIATSTTLVWYPINDTSKVAFYPINSSTNTASQIVTSVNALSNCSISGTAVGGGTGQVEYATYEAAPNGEGATNPWYYLTDGVNFVKTHNTPANTTIDFNFTFKKAITSSLASDSDWANEEVRIVPVTAKNVVNYLNSTGVSGLSSVAEVKLTDDGQKIQILSLTPGSEGAVHIQNGTANALTTAAQSSASSVASSTSVCSFNTTDIAGLSGEQWVLLENSTAIPKIGRITSSTALSSLDSVGNFTLSGTTAWTWGTTTTGIVNGAGGANWHFRRQGRYVVARCLATNINGAQEGDTVFVKVLSGSEVNSGTFKIVKLSGTDGFYFENENAVEEIVSCAVGIVRYNSILPGDILSINTSLWGNVGNFVVESIDLPSTTSPVAPFNGTGSTSKFKVTGVTTSVTGPIALGASYPLVQVFEKTPNKFVKRIIGISPNTSTISDIKFESHYGYEYIGEFAGTVLSPLDKLAFNTEISSGVDSYNHSTGLIEEANKIIYGVESDTSTYPGVAAVQSSIEIAGPLIKRIQVSLGIRVQTGINLSDVISKVKSEVAAVINNTNVGTSIAISDIIKAAQGVYGVAAVSVLNPVYSSANDLISVQNSEKPMVLSVDNDINISLVGE